MNNNILCRFRDEIPFYSLLLLILCTRIGKFYFLGSLANRSVIQIETRTKPNIHSRRRLKLIWEVRTVARLTWVESQFELEQGEGNIIIPLPAIIIYTHIGNSTTVYGVFVATDGGAGKETHLFLALWALSLMPWLATRAKLCHHPFGGSPHRFKILHLQFNNSKKRTISQLRSWGLDSVRHYHMLTGSTSPSKGDNIVPWSKITIAALQKQKAAPLQLLLLHYLHYYFV